MKLVILDRDGVINHDSPHHIKRVDEWKPIDGSLKAIASLGHAGFRVVVATNQSGVGRNLFDVDTLNAIHTKMHKAVAEAGGRIDALIYCPHTDNEHCDCRKPKPGMFLQIAERFNANLKDVPAIGDSLRDLQAASSAGCQPIMVRSGKGETTRKLDNLPKGTLEFANLAEAAHYILSAEKEESNA